jgi:hypothetical protein
MLQLGLETGRIYRFDYHGTNRIAVCLEQNGPNYLCWDFVSGGYRTFYIHDVQSYQDVTDKCVVTEDVDRKFKSNDVHTFERDGVLYAVRF